MSDKTSNTIPQDDVARVITLVFGTMDHGGPYWAYVSVVPSRYDEFMKLMASKQYDMQKFMDDGFGEIVVSGEGTLPPQEITKQVASIFEIPIRQLFANINPTAEIAKQIEDYMKQF